MRLLLTRNHHVSFAIVLAILLAGCAAQQLPPGYESLKTEASLLEVGTYYQGIRAAYVQARQQGIMPANEFVLAVKADQSFTAVWNVYLDAVQARRDTVQMWTAVVSNLGILEGLIRAWVPADVLGSKPAALTGS